MAESTNLGIAIIACTYEVPGINSNTEPIANSMPDPSQVVRVHSVNLAPLSDETTHRLHGLHHALSLVAHAAKLIRKFATAGQRMPFNIWQRRDIKIEGLSLRAAFAPAPRANLNTAQHENIF